MKRSLIAVIVLLSLMIAACEGLPAASSDFAESEAAQTTEEKAAAEDADEESENTGESTQEAEETEKATGSSASRKKSAKEEKEEAEEDAEEIATMSVASRKRSVKSDAETEAEETEEPEAEAEETGENSEEAEEETEEKDNVRVSIASRKRAPRDDTKDAAKEESREDDKDAEWETEWEDGEPEWADEETAFARKPGSRGESEERPGRPEDAGRRPGREPEEEEEEFEWTGGELAYLDMTRDQLVEIFNDYYDRVYGGDFLFPRTREEALAWEDYEQQMREEVAEEYKISPEDVEQIFLAGFYNDAETFATFNVDRVKVTHGDVKNVLTAVDYVEVEVIIPQKQVKKMTIGNHFENAWNFVKTYACTGYNKMSYAAYAEMPDGSLEKMISFTIPENQMRQITAQKGEPDTSSFNGYGGTLLFDCIDNFWIMPGASLSF